MPATRVVFYQELDGAVPVFDWLKQLRKRDRRAFTKCRLRITRLEASGHELRRPEADYLRDGIWELRIRSGRVHFRLLYFHHRERVCVVAHGLTKQDRVPDRDIDIALARKALYELAPEARRHEGPVPND
jgi:phage-related protein